MKTIASIFILTAAVLLSSSAASDVASSRTGFRHPGCLVTKSDIARIKSKLKAGDTNFVHAFEMLRNSQFARADFWSCPVPEIIRGAGRQNYMNAARGAATAWQNALVWRLTGDTNHAECAVRNLMGWARTTNAIGGNSNYALAAGIYGYEFANAGELLRGYKGWKAEEFKEYQDWMRRVWYPSAMGFLRFRNGTWENARHKPGAGHGLAGDRPGHYWSNWGLCNVLAVMSIGILCDDVEMYNRGVSFYKYDQCGTFRNPRQEGTIGFDGCQEFLGNLVVTTYDDDAEKRALGKVGQMAESGRDQGHAVFATGLAADICTTAYNQGDDLWAFMDDRLAAGLEFVAAYNVGGRDDLPWHAVAYADCAAAWHNAWVQLGPSGAGRGQVRNTWGGVIGYYEGVRGIRLPYSRMAFERMGIDGGAWGATSGGFDHLGFSYLLHYRDPIQRSKAPTPLHPIIIMDDGKTRIERAEIGATENRWNFESPPIAKGTQLVLKVELPKGERDTGRWLWDDGTKSSCIRMKAKTSAVRRVIYINPAGVKSMQAFFIAVAKS